MTTLPLYRPQFETDDRTAARKESRRNIENFFMPLAQARNGSFHTPGVIEGLSVSAALGQSFVRVSLGVALDPLGRVIVLAGDGWAKLHQAKPVLIKGSDVELPTDPGGEALLTIEWHEWTDTDIESDMTVLRHTPWLRWTKEIDKEDHQVVLARFELGNDGKIRSFSHRDRLISGCRASSVTLLGASRASTTKPWPPSVSKKVSILSNEMSVISGDGIIITGKDARFSWTGTNVSVDALKGSDPPQLQVNLMVGEEVILAFDAANEIVESSQSTEVSGDLVLDQSGVLAFAMSKSDGDYWLLQLRDGNLIIRPRNTEDASLELREDKILLGLPLGFDRKGHWVSHKNESPDTKVTMKAKTVSASSWRQYPPDPDTKVPVEHVKD